MSEGRHIRTGGPPMHSAEIREFDRRRTMPWTPAQLEAVRQAALAAVRTHRLVDGPGGEALTVIDGAAYWRLLHALDRSEER